MLTLPSPHRRSDELVYCWDAGDGAADGLRMGGFGLRVNIGDVVVVIRSGTASPTLKAVVKLVEFHYDALILNTQNVSAASVCL